MRDEEKKKRVEELYRGYKRDFSAVEDIIPEEAIRLHREGKALFIDVREKREQVVSMIPGAIRDEEFLKSLQTFDGKILIAYCTISYRSGKLAERLAHRGIRILNLQGGLLGWVHAGGPIVDQKGETRRIHVYGPKWDLAPAGYDAVW
ncbi:MAG: rhodanese-like domain-containing protein [Desulfobacterales bacterium]